MDILLNYTDTIASNLNKSIGIDLFISCAIYYAVLAAFVCYLTHSLLKFVIKSDKDCIPISVFIYTIIVLTPAIIVWVAINKSYLTIIL